MWRTSHVRLEAGERLQNPTCRYTFKGIGKVYGQVFIDSYSRVAATKLYREKTALTSADLLNDRVLLWYQEQGVPLLRILTDRGSEYKGKVANHA